MWMKVVAEGGARLITASRNSTSSGVSLARSAVERAEERDISETAERCTRVVVWLFGGVDERGGVKGADMRGGSVGVC